MLNKPKPRSPWHHYCPPIVPSSAGGWGGFMEHSPLAHSFTSVTQKYILMICGAPVFFTFSVWRTGSRQGQSDPGSEPAVSTLGKLALRAEVKKKKKNPLCGLSKGCSACSARLALMGKSQPGRSGLWGYWEQEWWWSLDCYFVGGLRRASVSPAGPVVHRVEQVLP
jgi:hypothetical protein